MIDSHFNDWLKRDKMICNLPSMIAYSLHPVYKGELLTPAQLNEVKTMIYNNGRGEAAFSQFQQFYNSSGLFGEIDASEMKTMSYWKLFSLNMPELGKTAMTYLPLPASSASLERVFSMWNFVHNKVRNRLSKQTSERLIFVYHAIHSVSKVIFNKFCL